MKIAKETYKPTDEDNEEIIYMLYSNISNEVKLKKVEIEENIAELIKYKNKLDNKQTSSNKIIFKLEQQYKKNVFEELNTMYEDLRRLDLFLELLSQRDDEQKSFIDIEPSDATNRLTKSMVIIFKDEALLSNFSSLVMGAVLTETYESFYASMCDFFQFAIEDYQISTFSIYSKMAQTLTNDLFNLSKTSKEINTKKKPTSKSISTSKYNTPIAHHKR